MNDKTDEFNAIMNSSRIACEILDILPDTDLVEELRTILNIQYSLCWAMLNSPGMSYEHLETFMTYLEQKSYEIEHLKEKNEQI